MFKDPEKYSKSDKKQQFSLKTSTFSRNYLEQFTHSPVRFNIVCSGRQNSLARAIHQNSKELKTKEKIFVTKGKYRNDNISHNKKKPNKNVAKTTNHLKLANKFGIPHTSSPILD